MDTEPVRTLVVDDEDAVRLTLAAVLERAGYHVLTAADGQAALDLLTHTIVALVVLDLFLPGLTGWAVAQRIQALRPTTGIMVRTGLNGNDSEPECWQAAGIPYLRKTSATEEVLRAVAMALAAVPITV